jgi:hypothetical protein
MNTKKDEMAVVPIHTSLTREVRPDRNFCELIERCWQTATTLGDMEGVLHRGYQVSLGKSAYGEKEYDEIDRHTFYLTIADGWEDYDLLELPTDGNKEYTVGYDSCGNVIKKSPCGLRQQLARKAFDMLCLNFFKKVELLVDGRHGKEFNKDWEGVIASERLFSIIQNFFRAEKGRSGEVRIRNLSRRDDKRSHNEEQAVNFLVNLAKFIWGWKEYEIESWSNNKKEEKKWNVEMRSRLDASKPWMVEVLIGLGRLFILRKWMLELDKACLDKIKEIALRSEFSEYQGPVWEDRPVASLDEACYLDSGGAWFLKEHELMVREHKRLEGIYKAKKKISDASREIKELTAK